MPKQLLIVESPAKAKTIKKYVGDDFDVLASKGHIMDLPKRGGVDVENGFKETYELLKEKDKPEIVKAIRASAKTASRVLLATDPDREGEAIAFHLKEIVEKANPNAEVKRVLFNEITKKGVLEGLENRGISIKTSTRRSAPAASSIESAAIRSRIYFGRNSRSD